MKPEMRTKNLMALLGWDGGTIHEACNEIGCEAHDFLYGVASFDDDGPCRPFRHGYGAAESGALDFAGNRGNLQYWFGAISAVANGCNAPCAGQED